MPMNPQPSLLAIDSTTQCLSVAVLHEGRITSRDAEGGARASALLLSMVDAVLRAAGLSGAQLDAIAFGCGPGAFTGLRTACAAAQGLALGWGKPVIAVNSLETLAAQAHARTGATRLASALDARMGDVYYALYHADVEYLHPQSDIYIRQYKDVSLPPGPWQGCGNAWHGADAAMPAIDGLVPPAEPMVPLASGMLPLAARRWREGRFSDAAHAEPLYIRNKVAFTTAERAQAAA
jgi:tRNA threonylcarbamoyladenosine biosynthesis protein TsaB